MYLSASVTVVPDAIDCKDESDNATFKALDLTTILVSQLTENSHHTARQPVLFVTIAILVLPHRTLHRDTLRAVCDK